MRVLIVDDEAPARQRLMRLLAEHDDVQVVGQAESAEQALQQIEALTPDALLLDVQMPGASGLDLAASLPDPAPAVVFVTAYDRYALAAFDTAAVDYLLKPVDPQRLRLALNRLAARQPQVAQARDRSQTGPTQILAPDRGRVIRIAVQDIIWLEAADNYVIVHHAAGAPLLRRTLASLLDDLGERLVRVHRSAAVALAQVRELSSNDKGDGLVTLLNGAQVPLSRTYRAELLRRLRNAG